MCSSGFSQAQETQAELPLPTSSAAATEKIISQIDQLRSEFKSLRTQYANSDSATQSIAIRQRLEQNRSQMEQLWNARIDAAKPSEDGRSTEDKETAFRAYVASLPEPDRQEIQQSRQLAAEFKTLKKEEISPEKRAAATETLRKKYQVLMQQTPSDSASSTWPSHPDKLTARQTFLQSLPEDQRATMAARIDFSDKLRAFRKQYADADRQTRGEAIRGLLAENLRNLHDLEAAK